MDARTYPEQNTPSPTNVNTAKHNASKISPSQFSPSALPDILKFVPNTPSAANNIYHNNIHLSGELSRENCFSGAALNGINSAHECLTRISSIGDTSDFSTEKTQYDAPDDVLFITEADINTTDRVSPSHLQLSRFSPVNSYVDGCIAITERCPSENDKMSDVRRKYNGNDHQFDQSSHYIDLNIPGTNVCHEDLIKSSSRHGNIEKSLSVSSLHESRETTNLDFTETNGISDSNTRPYSNFMDLSCAGIDDITRTGIHSTEISGGLQKSNAFKDENCGPYSNFMDLSNAGRERTHTSSTRSATNFLLSDNTMSHSSDNLLSCNSFSSSEFGAYSSFSNLDTDTFSKTERCYKWNLSASISDLSSAVKAVEENTSLDSYGLRSSASVSDLSSVRSEGSAKGGGKVSCGARTSFMAWSAALDHEETDMDYVAPLADTHTAATFSEYYFQFK